MLKIYYRLTKPGIVYGNALPTVAGFLFAANRHVHWLTLLQTVLGSSLVVASACVCNNYIDRGIDQKMNRTKHRALVEGTITGSQAVMFAALLGIVGFALVFVNVLAFTATLIGFIMYVFVYGYAKRHTTLGTLVGSVSGAMPPVIGYVAARGELSGATLVLFLILVAWQMPHFYAIALYRKKDYSAAKLPLLPLKKSVAITKIHMTGFAAVFLAACFVLATREHAGIIFGVSTTVIAGLWLLRCMRGFWRTDTEAWARQVFFDSLYVLLATCALIGASPWLA